ncbi:MAG: hypothetical protein HC902_01490 [Calothrix sp. SM1_5_4]|nr:hypothetical protein [Calothrix sp. SM1_5_4]
MGFPANISREVLKRNDERESLSRALAEMLSGIRSEWELTLPELAAVLNRPQGTVKGWLSKDGAVGLDATLDPNTQGLIDFIEIYNMVASFYVSTADQRSWLRTASAQFGNMSPFQMMSENPHNLMIAREIVSRMLNP